MATHSSTLARKIPWMEEPGRLQSMGRWESDMTEWLHFYFSLSCTGEGNGNPLQYSCLENPREGEAWWAAVYGVAQSWTRLKRLSSSSSSSVKMTVAICIKVKTIFHELLPLCGESFFFPIIPNLQFHTSTILYRSHLFQSNSPWLHHMVDVCISLKFIETIEGWVSEAGGMGNYSV